MYEVGWLNTKLGDQFVPPGIPGPPLGYVILLIIPISYRATFGLHGEYLVVFRFSYFSYLLDPI